MEIKGKVAVVTGAGSGIGHAAAVELVMRGVKAVALVDLQESVKDVAARINEMAARPVAYPFLGDTTDATFRRRVFDEIRAATDVVRICVPAAGITRDALAVKLDRCGGKTSIYAEETFRQVLEVNLIAPVYWALEMVAQIAAFRQESGNARWRPAEEKLQGATVFIGSVSSQGNKGQIAYAAAKRGLEGAAATLMKEAIYYGVRCIVIHPGFTDTPMVRSLGREYIEQRILPFTQLGRLIRPDEIAGAICFMIQNSAVSGELWADAGWHPSA
jgi:3-oxoacyl-[acyl-carrier protein] reductase